MQSGAKRFLLAALFGAAVVSFFYSHFYHY